jgi:hypothetical protein
MTVYAQRRLDSAQKRYLHAIKQLAMVRKLLKKPDPTKNKSADADGKGKQPRPTFQEYSSRRRPKLT